MITYFSGSSVRRVKIKGSMRSTPSLEPQQVHNQPIASKDLPPALVHDLQVLKIEALDLRMLLTLCRQEEDKVMAADERGWTLEGNGIWTATLLCYLWHAN